MNHRKDLLIVFIFYCLPFIGLTQNKVIAIKNISIIDVRTGTIKKQQAVIIEGNKIASINNKLTIPPTATVIDGAGKWLIPGLWDMHAHSFSDRKLEWLFPLLIANGVTGVRDMATGFSFDSIHMIKKEVADGRLPGPRLEEVTQKVFNGVILPGMPNMEVNSPEEARQQVRNYKRQGMDFIKVYNQLSREVFLAIIDEAKLQKIPVLGHVPFSMTAAGVSDLGQLSIEHNTDILVSCSSEETKLRQSLDSLPKTLATGSAPRQNIDFKAMLTFDEQKAISLFRRFIHNGTWMCPTLVIPQRSVKEVDELSRDDRLQYIPQRFREQWATQMNQRNINPVSENGKLLLKKRIDIVGLMHRTGVNILAGSDFMNPYVYPGFSLHDELKLLVKAGLSPLEALQTATINPAKYFQNEKELGQVEEGSYADLVILNANPLENIANTEKIYGVILNGRWFERKKLDEMLENVKALVKTR